MAAKNNLIFAGYLWYITYPKSYNAGGALAEMKNQGIPPEVIEKLKDSLDCNLYFFGSHVNIGTMYIILGITVFVLIGIYVLLNKSKKYNN